MLTSRLLLGRCMGPKVLSLASFHSSSFLFAKQLRAILPNHIRKNFWRIMEVGCSAEKILVKC